MSEPFVHPWVLQWLEKPDSFAVWGDWAERVDTGRWTYGPVIRHRDSDVLTLSNAEVMLKLIAEKFPEWDADESTGDWSVQGASSWLVGHMDHLVFRALDEGGEMTEIARFVVELYERMDDYPILDEEHYSAAEYEDAIETIAACWASEAREHGAPENWEYEVHGWLGDNGYDTYGPAIDSDSVLEALDDLWPIAAEEGAPT